MTDCDLTAWLKDNGFHGRALERACEKLDEGDIFTIEDLAQLAASPQHFAEQFPSALTRLKIETALAKGTGSSPEPDKTNRSLVENDAKDETKSNDTHDGSNAELPQGKRYV